MNMKKKYLEPVTELVSVKFEGTVICASGENLTSRSYGSYAEEEEDGFWD